MATKKKRTSKSKTAQNVKAVVDNDQDLDADDIIDSSTPRKMPWFGWLGLAIMIVGEITVLSLPTPPKDSGNAANFIVIAFTPIMWTGYILLVDAWIWARGDRSFFRDGPLHWPMLALFSILIWVMFETFNFAVQGWHYGYIPPNPLVRNLLYAWAFATIIPAMLRTRSLFATFKLFDKSHQWDIRWTPFKLAFSFIAGIAFTFLPVMLDWKWANICVWLIWIGFIFMIEPILYYVKPSHSIFRDLESRQYGGNGKVSFFWQAFWAGLLCGFIWESWNWQTLRLHGLYWNYNIAQVYWDLGFGLHWGRMPVLGFLGYPPFIWECYALFELIEWTMHGDQLWKLPAKAVRAVTSRVSA